MGKMGKNVIAIEARVAEPALIGGVAQVIMSLADGLSQLEDGDEEYVFIGTGVRKIGSESAFTAPAACTPHQEVSRNVSSTRQSRRYC
jgi:hypothetical protein